MSSGVVAMMAFERSISDAEDMIPLHVEEIQQYLGSSFIS